MSCLYRHIAARRTPASTCRAAVAFEILCRRTAALSLRMRAAKLLTSVLYAAGGDGRSAADARVRGARSARGADAGRNIDGNGCFFPSGGNDKTIIFNGEECGTRILISRLGNKDIWTG